MLQHEGDTRTRDRINSMKRGRRTWPTLRSPEGYTGIDSSGMGAPTLSVREVNEDDTPSTNAPPTGKEGWPKGLLRGIETQQKSPKPPLPSTDTVFDA